MRNWNKKQQTNGQRPREFADTKWPGIALREVALEESLRNWNGGT